MYILYILFRNSIWLGGRYFKYTIMYFISYLGIVFGWVEGTVSTQLCTLYLIKE